MTSSCGCIFVYGQASTPLSLFTLTILSNVGTIHFRSTLKPGLHRNANRTRIVKSRHVTETRQTAFGSVTNVRRTAECDLSTVGTSKGIRIQYVYVGSICCLGECRTVYQCAIHSALALARMSRSHADVHPALKQIEIGSLRMHI